MQKVIEKEMIEIQKYELTVIVEDATKSEKIHATISLMDSDDHMTNFHYLASMVDSGIASIERHLSKDEKDKIYDFNINGQFDEANKMEETAKRSWEAEFLKHAA